MAELGGHLVVRLDACEAATVRADMTGRPFVLIRAGSSAVELHFRSDTDLRLWARAVLTAAGDKPSPATRTRANTKGAARARTV